MGIKRRIGHLACISDNLNGMGSGREAIYIFWDGRRESRPIKRRSHHFSRIRNTPKVYLTYLIKAVFGYHDNGHITDVNNTPKVF